MSWNTKPILRLFCKWCRTEHNRRTQLGEPTWHSNSDASDSDSDSESVFEATVAAPTHTLPLPLQM